MGMLHQKVLWKWFSDMQLKPELQMQCILMFPFHSPKMHSLNASWSISSVHIIMQCHLQPFCFHDVTCFRVKQNKYILHLCIVMERTWLMHWWIDYNKTRNMNWIDSKSSQFWFQVDCRLIVNLLTSCCERESADLCTWRASDVIKGL